MERESTDIAISTASFDQVPALVGRQPIFDRRLQVFAYELLYRRQELDGEADFADGDQATARVLANAFVELGFDVVTGGKPAFVNLTRAAISDQMAHLFPPERIVAEILEDVDADTEVLAHVRDLKDAGYLIALDDFLFREGVDEFVDLADIVKIDLMQLSRAEVRSYCERIRSRGPKLLAEKIETQDDYQFCHDLGFDYFQGYFLCEPQVVAGRARAGGQIGVLQLIAKLNNPDSTVEELEQVIQRDARLSYNLMKYINSAAFAMTIKVESIHHALMMLGRRMVAVWANMVVVAGFKGKPNELLTTAMMRARMSEQLARRLGRAHPDTYFTAGLFSILDALLDQPMAEVLEEIVLGEELGAALLNREGDIGFVLDQVIRYERGHWDDLAREIATEDLKTTYFDAMRWTSKVLEA